MKEFFGGAALGLAAAAGIYAVNLSLGTQDAGSCRLAVAGLLTLSAMSGVIGLFGLSLGLWRTKQNG